MKTWLWIGLGGAAGSMGRYAVNLLTDRFVGSGFPWSTLTVNAVGCFLIPLVLLGPWEVPRDLRLTLGVGLLGGFTTFSAFGHETIALIERGSVGYGIINVVANVVVGLAAAAAGWHLARSVG